MRKVREAFTGRVNAAYRQKWTLRVRAGDVRRLADDLEFMESLPLPVRRRILRRISSPGWRPIEREGSVGSGIDRERGKGMTILPGHHYHRCRCGAPPFRTTKPTTDLCGMPVSVPGIPPRRCAEPPRLLRVVRNADNR